MVRRILAAGAAICMIGVFGLLVAAMCGWFDEGAVTFERGEITIESAGAVVATLDVEIAKTERQQRRGLMFRKSLDDDKGMLFVFGRDSLLGFHMTNTEIDLDIAFIRADGTIFEIKTMKANDPDVKTPSAPYRYALEVRKGYFIAKGIAVGDMVKGEALGLGL